MRRTWLERKSSAGLCLALILQVLAVARKQLTEKKNVTCVGLASRGIPNEMLLFHEELLPADLFREDIQDRAPHYTLAGETENLSNELIGWVCNKYKSEGFCIYTVLASMYRCRETRSLS